VSPTLVGADVVGYLVGDDDGMVVGVLVVGLEDG
jgi:hypothetical protein